MNLLVIDIIYLKMKKSTSWHDRWCQCDFKVQLMANPHQLYPLIILEITNMKQDQECMQSKSTPTFLECQCDFKVQLMAKPHQLYPLIILEIVHSHRRPHRRQPLVSSVAASCLGVCLVISK